MAALGTPEFEADETGELFAYTGRPTDVGGEFDALVEWESQKRQLPLLVVAGAGPALVGRNWVRAIRIDWDRILHPPNAYAASKMDPFKDVFELGAIQVPPVQLVLKADAVRMLVSPGILYSVVCSDWEAPVVVGPIANGSLRVCSGEKMAANPTLLELEPFSKEWSGATSIRPLVLIGSASSRLVSHLPLRSFSEGWTTSSVTCPG